MKSSWRADYESARFTLADVSTWLQANPGGSSLFPFRMGNPFICSRVAAAYDHPDEAIHQYNDAKTISPFEGDQSFLGDSDRIKEDIADGLLNFAVGGLENTSKPRVDCLNDMQFIADHFPDSRPVRRAKEYARMLRQMVEEDRSHRAISTERIAKLTEDQQVAEWIFRLREQTGEQISEPGYCDVFKSFSGESNDSPAWRLLALQFASIPRLLDALEDTRLTRAVQGGMHVVHPFPLRFGDAARQILEAISGRDFHDSNSVYQDFAASSKSVEAAARKWWATVQIEGEKQWLSQRVARAEYTWPVGLPAKRLAHLSPGAALIAVRKGIRASTDERERAELVDSLDSLRNPAVRRFMLEMMSHGPDPSTRLAAARIAHSTDPKITEEVITAQWIKLHPSDQEFWIVQDVARFIAGWRDVKSIEALSTPFKDLMPFRRSEVLNALVGANPRVPLEPGYSQRLQRFLASELTDRARLSAGPTWIGNQSFNEPRICDLASYCLAKLWPNRYRYDFSTSDRAHDRQCRETLNIWRRSQGKPPLTPPERDPMSPQDLVRISTALERANSEIDLRRLEEFGPAAIPVVESFQKRHSPSNTALARTRAEIIRLGNIVTQVNLANVPRDASSIASMATSMRGETLSCQSVEAIISTTIRTWKQDWGPVRLTILRDPDCAGAIMTLDMAQRDVARSEGGGFDYAYAVSIGGSEPREVKGDGDVNELLLYLDDLYNQISTAIGQQPNVEYSITISLGQNGR